MQQEENPIGILDSGIGGLTVAHAVSKILPHEQIIYIGDTARVPYGDRSKEEIIYYSQNLIDFLLKKRVKMIVIACNTIAVAGFHRLQKYSPVPLINVIQPTIETAVKLSHQRIGILGTTTTIKSNIYGKQIRKYNPDIAIINKACPLFVPVIEGGLINHPITESIINSTLQPVKQKQIDSLILGCTHYPFLESAIQKYLGNAVKIITSGIPTASVLQKYLNQHNLTATHKNPVHQFYFSGKPLYTNHFINDLFNDQKQYISSFNV